jgi:glycosyltransferase involved in cell wall biosynthesis
LISVIIPVYNRQKELLRALKSVFHQTYQDFEVLVIDDNSEIDLKASIKALNDKRIHYQKLPKKGNANVARNLGIKKAKGEYIAFLDSDDEWMPNHLERRIEKINEWNCDGVFGSAKIYHPDHNTYKISRRLKKNENIVNYLLSDGFAPTPSMVFKKDTLKGNLWDEDLKRHQDYDFLARLNDRTTLCSDPEPTIIVHWENQKETYHFDSCVKFISKFKGKIHPKVYNAYHSKLLWFARSVGDQQYIKHYERESVKYPKYLSLSEFLNSPMKRKFPFRIFYKIKFALINIF